NIPRLILAPAIDGDEGELGEACHEVPVRDGVVGAPTLAAWLAANLIVEEAAEGEAAMLRRESLVNRGGSPASAGPRGDLRGRAATAERQDQSGRGTHRPGCARRTTCR